MISRIAQKVRDVRLEPEHVRMRYVMICLAVSMIFIVGIWMLTLRESLANARTDREAVETLTPTLGGEPSLSDLDSLRVEDQAPKTGQEYFNEQFEASENSVPASESPNLSGEGMSGANAGTP